MSSWADMAKRIAAAPPPVATEKQAKKQKTTTAVAAESGAKNKSETKAGPKNAWSKGGSKAALVTKLPHNQNQQKQPPKQSQQNRQQQLQQDTKKKQQQTKKSQTSQKQQQQQQQSKQGQQNAKKNPQQPKFKARKPTLKTMSLADVLTSIVGIGGAKSTAPETKPPQQPREEPLQSSDFPSLSASNQSTSAWPAVSILKRPTQEVAPKSASKNNNNSKPTEKTASQPKPAAASKSKATTKQPPAVPKDSIVDKPKPSLAASLLGARQERQLDRVDDVFGFISAATQQQQGGGIKVIPGRQRLRPRKKKFSSLKKKVLDERLRQWKESNNQNDDSNDGSAIETPRTLCLYGFADEKLVQDDDEYEELCANLIDLAEKISQACRICIPRHVSDRFDSEYPCFVEFDSATSVEAAISCWNGLSLGGEKLLAQAISVPHGATDETEWKELCLEVESLSKDGKSESQSDGRGQVVLMDILTEDDLEDPDCLKETLADIERLGEEFGEIIEVSVDKDKQSVLLAYKGGLSAAKTANAALGQKVLGGTLIKSALVNSNGSGGQSRVILHGILTEDDMEDNECLEETIEDIREVVSEYGTVSDISAEKAEARVVVTYVGGIHVAQHAATELGKKVIGGVQVRATVDHRSQLKKSILSWSIILKGALTEDDLEDDDCLGESLADLKELAGKFGTVLSVRSEEENVRIEFEGPKEVAVSAAFGFSGIVIGGSTITAHVDEDEIGMDTDNPVIASQPIKVATSPKEPEAMFSGEKRIPGRFAEVSLKIQFDRSLYSVAQDSRCHFS